MLTLFVMGWEGGEGYIVPAADFFVYCGSIRDLEKALDKVKKAHGEKGQAGNCQLYNFY